MTLLRVTLQLLCLVIESLLLDNIFLGFSLEYNAEFPKSSEILVALFLSINLLPSVKFSLDLREKFRAGQISV